MPLFDRLNQSRQRRRVHSRFDSRMRKVIRRIERWFRFLLSRPLGMLLRPRRATLPLAPASISNILILRYDAIGDAILTTPLFRVLKRYAPHISIGVGASGRNRLLFDHDPDVDRVYILSESSPIGLVRELFRARKIKWDVVINLVFRDKTRGAIFAKLIAPHAITITSVREKQEKYLQLYSALEEMPPLYPPTPEATQDLDLLLHTIALPAEAAKEVPSLPDFSSMTHPLCDTIGSILRGSAKTRYIIINTDAAQLFREWGHDNSLALAKMIVEQLPDAHVFLTSAPSRGAALRERINSAALNNISYLETPSILHLATALRGAAAVISPDTSVIHFATAQQVPVVGLYLEENEFLPFGGPSRVLIPADGKTMSRITPEQVFRALKELIESVTARSAY